MFFLTLNSFSQIPEELFEFLENKDTTQLYFGADEDPEFPGGRSGMIKYYQKKLYYPTEARRLGTQGTVYVMFIVEKDGKLTNVKATNSVDKQLDKAAVRLVKKMPNWKPGEIAGKIVRVLHVLPVVYQLE